MAEQTFKSPGFFDTEIVTERRQNLEQIITTVPAGVVGFSEKGPAFTPITVNSYERFVEIFGEANSDYPSTLAVKKYLEHRDALTFVRVLGAGANTTESHFVETERLGTVTNAGFIVTSSVHPDPGKQPYGAVQFLCAEHDVAAIETVGYPVFASNNTTLSNDPYIVRGILFTTSGSKFVTLDHDDNFDPHNDNDFNGSTISSTQSDEMYGKFKLLLTSSDGSLGTVNGFNGVKVFSASLNPNDEAYVSKVLNTDPTRFQQDKHLLYAHFPIENELAPLKESATKEVTIGLMRGSTDESSVSGKMFSTVFGNFRTRYQAPKTTKFISQPFGKVEYDLFHFECIDDGRHANDLYKISISNIRKSNDPENPYPLFDVELRAKRDLDTSLQIIESFINCDLNPNSENFIASKIGDMKLVYNFDTTLSKERRLTVQGTYPNLSARIRVVLSDDLKSGLLPKEAAPFGFRGLPALKTFNEEPNTTNLDQGEYENGRFGGITYSGGSSDAMTGSILPPLPFRYKLTTGEARGNAQGDFSYVGEGSLNENVVRGLSWGVKFERLPAEGEIASPVNRSNESIVYNELIDNMSKFLGIQKLDALVTGSGADDFNHNKFTLARVGLGKFLLGTETLSNYSHFLTGSARDEMKNAAYIRDAVVDGNDYSISDDIHSDERLTLASLMSLTSSVYFNRFSDYTKFTNMFYGGFDGTNILDKDQSVLNDKATSSDTGGKGVDAPDIGLNMSFGSGDSNSYVNSYKAAVNLLTDPAQSRINILTFPGIRSDELIAHAIERVEEYGKALLLLDVPHVNSSGVRMYEDTSGNVNVRKSIESFSDRNYDTSYAASYFPDVVVEDNGKRKLMPATVAALSAIGFNDNTSYPWFAPAGFNRGSLSFVTSARARLNKDERDVAYEARINPISTFPKSGYVISGQKTLQRARTSLDRVNVRRMLLEVKRVVSDISINFVFEANTPEVRSMYHKRVSNALADIQENQGIDQFKVVIDSTNNTQNDIDNNILNGRIILVPTRAIEFVAIDFVISNSGIDFV